jgi:hypothetical protein
MRGWGWWGRRSRPPGPVHDAVDPTIGADPRDASDDDVFLTLVRSELDRLGCQITRLDVREAVVSGRMRGTVGLRNIQQTCIPLPRAAWRGVIAEHLGGLAQAAEIRLDLRDLDAVRPLLRARLYDEAGDERGLLAGRVVAPGLFEALVVDQPRSVHGVPTAVASGWGEPVDELLELARAQVLDDGLLTRQQLDLGAASATLLEDASPYTSGHLAWLPSYIDVPRAGALVAVPTRHLLLAHPMLEREATLSAAHALLLNADRLYDRGPGGISPHLYWWRPEEIVLLPGSVVGERVELRPPQEFVRVLETLPE